MRSEEHLFEQLDLMREYRLLELCDIIATEAGTTLIRQGAWTDDIFIVKEGKLKVIDVRGENEFILATVGPGDVFGEMSFLDGSPRSATVAVQEAGSILRLSRNGFLHLFEQDPVLGARLLLSLGRLLALRLRMADSALCMLSDDSEARERYELRRLIGELRRSVMKGRLIDQDSDEDEIGEIHRGI